jgi:hypothetical protein
MHFTIPATKFTKAIIVSITLSGAVVALVDTVNVVSSDDECWFINRYGISVTKF